MVFDQIYGTLLVWLEFMIIIRHEILDIPRSSRPTVASLKPQNSYRPVTQSFLLCARCSLTLIGIQNTSYRSRHEIGI